MKTPAGRRLVETYYRLAPALAKTVQKSPELAAAFRTMALTFLANSNLT